jgi:hypothetical protein
MTLATRANVPAGRSIIINAKSSPSLPVRYVVGEIFLIPSGNDEVESMRAHGAPHDRTDAIVSRQPVFPRIPALGVDVMCPLRHDPENRPSSS